MRLIYLLLFSLFFFAGVQAQPVLSLVDFSSNFDRPVDLTHCGDSRLFVVEQDGKIWVLDSNGVRLNPSPFLDIDPRVRSTGNEQGLLGLAFHPQYAQNGYFFVYYINNDGDTQISRFSVSTGNANAADPDSEFKILFFDQPYTNHNGGSIKFGSDGYLYIGSGDGGSGGDPQAYGQNKNTFLGKMLRIDINSVTANTNYEVPADNPFVGQTAYKPEIWSLGWRNPWRFSFDKLTGDIWAGDVGQNAREEIDFEPKNTGGRNYGWRCYEGFNTFNTAGCPPANTLTAPVFAYPNPSKGCSVTGGFVYRGTKYPKIYGTYLFADYCSGRWWVTKPDANGAFVTTEIANLTDFQYSSFGEDIQGELYVCLLTSGKIQRITELCTGFEATGTSDDVICEETFAGSVELNVSGGQNPISYTWSTGATTQNISGLNPGTYSVEVKDGNNCITRDTVVIPSATPATPILEASDDVICQGEAFTITFSDLVLGNILLLTINGVTQPPITISEPTYTATFTEGGTFQAQTANDTCASAISEAVSVDYEFQLPPYINVTNSVTLSVATSGWAAYQWLLNGQPIPGATDTLYVATQSGDYSLQTTNANGCIYQSLAVTIVVSDTETPLFVEAINVTPNPTDSDINISLTLRENMQFNLFLVNETGQITWKQTVVQSKLSQNISLRTFPAGVYHVVVQTEKGVVVRKIVKN